MDKNKTKRLVALAILSAVIVVLQLLSTVFKIGTISITLTLVPLVVGAAFFGPSAGAILGAVFGVIVYINCIIGLDPGGNVPFAANPFLTAVVCLVKGAAAGWCAGFAYKLIARDGSSPERGQIGVYVSACIAPVVNTGLFCLGMLLFFKDTLTEWAGGEPIFSYIILGLAGVNFLVELGINLVLSPVISTIIRSVRKSRA